MLHLSARGDPVALDSSTGAIGEAQALVKQAARQGGDLRASLAVLCAERGLPVPDIAPNSGDTADALALGAVRVAREALQ